MPDPSMAFAGNASYGMGGQGEFLRQMVHALAGEPGSRIYARDPGPSRNGVAVRRRAATRAAHATLRLAPGLRARDDWATLIDDVDFDAGVTRALPRVALFDGVMGQCARAAAAAAGHGARVIVTSLNTHIDALADVMAIERARTPGAPGSFVHPGMRRRARREMAMADWIRVPSARAAATFEERGVKGERLHMIRPAVDLSHFRPQPLRGDAAFRVLAVASIDLRKGARHLLEAFTTARLPGGELDLIGGTGSRWARLMLARYRRDHANITLRHVDVTRAPAADTYGRASVLVHAAIEDGYGLVVAQALAAGRPVIVTEATGASELVEDGVNGFVVPAGSPAAIREKLQLLASDRALLVRMSAQAPASVAHLGYDAFRETVLAFYRKVTA